MIVSAVGRTIGFLPRMDQDKDGSLSVTEFARFWPAVRRLRPENAALGAPLDNADSTAEDDASSATTSDGGGWGVNLKSGKPKQKRNEGVIRAKASQAKKLFATRDDNSVSACFVYRRGDQLYAGVSLA